MPRPFAFAFFSDDETPLGTLRAALPPRERERASQFSARRSRHFVLGRLAARAALRELGELGETVGVEILSDSKGAPQVWGSQAQISISHSGQLAAAIAWFPMRRGVSWGADVERVRPCEVGQSEWAFSRDERKIFAPSAGLAAWAVKEAAWKALRPAKQRGRKV